MPRKPKQEKAQGVFEKPKGSGIFWIRYTDAEGKRRAESVGRFSDAKERYAARKLELKTGVQLITPRRQESTKDSGAILLSTLVEDGIKFSKRNHKDFRNFIQRAEVWKEHFGDRPADSIKPADISDWLEDMMEQWEWSPATFNRYKNCLSKLYKIAIHDSKVTTNPARLVPLKKESKGRIRFLTEEEEARIRKTILENRPHRLPQFELAIHTGMRKGEQFSLDWYQVDTKNANLHLESTKNGSDRYIHLNKSALSALEVLKSQKQEKYEGAVFDIKDPRNWFENTCDEAKVYGVTWHILRHTFASRLVMKGVNLKTVQELMGHKTISMTARYAHLAPGYLKEAIATLDNATETAA